MKEIYFAGGCFWGVEHFFKQVKGIEKTEVGYINGNEATTDYEKVCNGSGHAEGVMIIYDKTKIALEELIDLFFQIIDPISFQKQGNDYGIQYRTGIYYIDIEDKVVIEQKIKEQQLKYNEPILTEIESLKHFCKAEEYHQNYLDKHPFGYCHISKDKMELAHYYPLTSLQYKVIKKGHTEPPYKNEYFNHFKKGIYVDIETGIPLFSSKDKFDSGCGWPTFAKPIEKNEIIEKLDLSHGMLRKEVRSKKNQNHLGHVFKDGPKEKGGLRYCINSASLKFIPKEEMAKKGYSAYLNVL